jgi:PAS domain S-box-containing protein
MQPQVPSSEQALGSGNSLWRILIDKLPDCVCVKDTQSRILMDNLAHAQMLGAVHPDEVVGKTDFDYFSKELAERYFAEEQALMRSGEILNRIESMADKATGEVRWLQTTKIPLRDGAGKVIGLVGISRDITEHKRADEALAHTHEQLQAMLDNIPDRVYFKDTQSRFVKCNQAVARRLGVEDPERVVGKKDSDFYPPEKAEEFYQDEQRIIQAGKPLINKIEMLTRPSGEVTWSSVSKVPLRDKEGKIVGLVGISRDITEQKQAEDVLRQSRDALEQRVAERTAELSRERFLLRTLIDILPDSIYTKDVACRKTLANPADLKNIGCKTEAEAIGKSDFDLFPREIAEKFYADDQKVIQGQPVLNREEYFLDQDGQQHWLLTSKLPLRNPNGDIVGLVGVGRDITAIKEADRKLEALHHELLSASRQAGMAEVATGVLHNVGNVLNSVNVSVTLINDQLRNFRAEGVTKVAHLLREHGTDLGRFLTEDERGRQVPAYLDELAKYLDAERAVLRRELQVVTGNINHIKEIVAMQQENAHTFDLVETLPLSNLVEDALRLNGAAYTRHGVTVKREYDPLPAVSVDKHKLLQILMNLFSNAKNACNARGSTEKKVEVRLKTGGMGRVRIEVTDNGVGIPPENLTQIFSQGFTTRKGGHGFGLHSSALAAKELGGSLTARSDGLGQGATFTLELPAASAKDLSAKPQS